jgi:hypothetical protein
VGVADSRAAQRVRRQLALVAVVASTGHRTRRHPWRAGQLTRLGPTDRGLCCIGLAVVASLSAELRFPLITAASSRRRSHKAGAARSLGRNAGLPARPDR